MTAFLELPIETNPEAILEAMYERMAEQFPGWEPAEGNIEMWIARWISESAVPDLANLVAEVSGDIFQQYGAVILGIPQVPPAPAVATALWVMRDTAGYTVPAGTQVQMMTSGNTAVAFETSSQVTIPPSQKQKNIDMRALEPGTEGNDLTGTAVPVSALAFVESVTVSAPSHGGVDPETDDAYRQRLAAEAQLLSPAPILPSDATVLARRVPGVARAMALDLYNPDTGATDAERTLTLVPVDAAGEPVDPATKAAVQALLESLREVSFVFFVIDPTYTDVDVSVTVVKWPGSTDAQVANEIEDVLGTYLSPATWGSDRDPTAWRQQTTVYLNEIIALVDRVEVVDRVVSVQLGKNGGAQAAADISLTGKAPLTRPGAITVSVS